LQIENGRAIGRETLSAGHLNMNQLIGDLMAGGFRGPFEFELFPGDLRGRDIGTLITDYAKEFSDCVAAT
jgi:hypothetical protein